MVKILCVGDIHVQTNNIDQINEFLNKLIQFISQESIDITVLMGDILHTHERLHTVAFNTVTNIFKQISSISKTYVLVGNHDYINNSQFLTTNHWMNCFKEYPNLTIIDKVHIETIDNKIIVFAPYVPDGRFKEALSCSVNETWKTADYIFAHQLFDGAKMGAIVAENVETWNEDLPLLISGHIHDKQQIQKNLIYTGSCLQHAFGESSDKTLLLIENSGELRYIDLDLSKKKILYMEIEDIEAIDISLFDDTKKTQYKIVVNGDNTEFNNFRKTILYRDIIKTGTKIVFKQKRIEILKRNEMIKSNINGNNTNKNCKTFKEILKDLVEESEENRCLSDVYSELVLEQTRNDEIVFDDDDNHDDV